jgi:hypothetical protein
MNTQSEIEVVIVIFRNAEGKGQCFAGCYKGRLDATSVFAGVFLGYNSGGERCARYISIIASTQRRW